MGDESIREKIKELEKEISTTKYNKRTQHHVGLVKAQIAKLKEKIVSRSKGKKAGEGYSVRKTGDATVVLLGFPSVGKSTLLNAMTNAESPVGSYAFTTLTVIPGLLAYKNAKIQILDVPGIVEGAASGRGRGKEVLQVIRNADMIIILIDALDPKHLKVILKEVYDTGVRINQRPPDVKIKKMGRGGVRIGSTVRLTKIDEKTIEDMLKMLKISNADVLVRDDITPDQLIDVVETGKVYIPAITVLNKMDLVEKSQLDKIKREIKPDLMISAQNKKNVEKLKDLIFKKLNLIRLYLKEVNKRADMEEPMIIFKDAKLKDLCEKLHKDFVTRFRFARLWGKSARFDGQRILKLTHTLKDRDIVELHIS